MRPKGSGSQRANMLLCLELTLILKTWYQFNHVFKQYGFQLTHRYQHASDSPPESSFTACLPVTNALIDR